MSLHSCRECRGEVSSQAFTCPHCGAPYPARERWNGWGYEWKSGVTILGLPLVHIAFGRRADGKLRIAKGVIAIGQFAFGLVTIAQFGFGLVFGLGQLIVSPFAVSQLAAAYAAVAQIAVAKYALAQAAIGEHLWTMAQKDPEAVEFFSKIARALGLL